MNCPKCNGELVEVVKHSVVIDSCSGCSGIWLDKGEMSKIISQMKQAEASLDDEFRPLFSEKRDYYDKYRRRQKSTLERIFDILD